MQKDNLKNNTPTDTNNVLAEVLSQWRNRRDNYSRMLVGLNNTTAAYAKFMSRMSELNQCIEDLNKAIQYCR